MVDKTNTEQFKELIKDDTIPLVVDAYADWCMPCKLSSPKFEEMSKQYIGKAKFIKINVDEEPGIAQAFNIRGVPSFFILKGNKIKEAVVGADLKRLQNSLDKLLEKTNQPTMQYN